jgi:hypothetical protein
MTQYTHDTAPTQYTEASWRRDGFRFTALGAEG